MTCQHDYIFSNINISSSSIISIFVDLSTCQHHYIFSDTINFILIHYGLHYSHICRLVNIIIYFLTLSFSSSSIIAIFVDLSTSLYIFLHYLLKFIYISTHSFIINLIIINNTTELLFNLYQCTHHVLLHIMYYYFPTMVVYSEDVLGSFHKLLLFLSLFIYNIL